MTPRDAKVVVPDASVILKWIDRMPGGDDRDSADVLLDAWINGRIEIVVPALWAFEVANVLGREDPDGAAAIMEDLIGYRFEVAETNPELCRTAFALMRELGVAFHHAVYHAVALLRGGVYVTADESYLRKAASRGGVVLLREFMQAGR